MNSTLVAYTSFLEQRLKKNLHELHTEFLELSQQSFDYESLRGKASHHYSVLEVPSKTLRYRPDDVEDPFEFFLQIAQTYPRVKNNLMLRVMVHNRNTDRNICSDFIHLTITNVTNPVAAIKDAWSKETVLNLIRERFKPKAAVEIVQSDALLQGNPLKDYRGKRVSMAQSRVIAYFYANVLNDTYPLVDLRSTQFPKTVAPHLSNSFLDALEGYGVSRRWEKKSIQSFSKHYPTVHDFAASMDSHYF